MSRLTTFAHLALGTCLALSACGGGDGGDGAGDGDAGDGADGGGGGGGDGGGGDDDACTKIDLLISVDPSSSMAQELAAMSSIFGEFATALLDVNDEFENFRTGVVDSCPRPATFNTSSSAAPCDFASGESWIDSASPSMVAEYQCVGDLDTTFDCNTGNDEDEQPLKAAIAALQVGTNPGFVRDDALLVVLAITDEDEEMVLDDDSTETYTTEQIAAHAQGLYEDLVAIKGDASRMVFIDIAGGTGGCTAEQGAYGQALQADIMNATADRFIANERGVKWNLCDGNLSQALSEAMEVIDRACDDFGPIE